MKQKQPTIACNESVHQYDPFREIGPTKNRWGSEFTSAMEYIAVTYVTPSTTPVARFFSGKPGTGRSRAPFSRATPPLLQPRSR